MDWLVVSNILLWGLIVFLTVVVLTLARQVSLLSDHEGPNSNPIVPSKTKIGEVTKEIKGIDLDGKPRKVGGANSDSSNLVVFISPTYPVCKTLVPEAISLASQEKLDLIFAGGGGSLSLPEHQNYAVDLGLKNHSYLVSDTLSTHYDVDKLPFALLINEQGVLIDKGFVNTLAHLEGMIKGSLYGVSASQ